MRSRVIIIGKFLMVMSLCMALGLHWAALQSVAWAGMLLSYSRSGSVAEAFVKTFDGKHPCPLCRAIGKSHGSDQKPVAPASVTKIDLEYPGSFELPLPPVNHFRWAAVSMTACGFAPEPVIPPPRAA